MVVIAVAVIFVAIVAVAVIVIVCGRQLIVEPHDDDWRC